MADWEITKPTGQCSGSGQPIEEGEEYFAALVETDQGFERKDYSFSYWQENNPDVFYFWKTKLSDPNKKKKIFIDDEMLMAFFDRLEDRKEPDKINFRFVLTLILMRKRLLRYDSSRFEDDKDIWTLKVTGQKKTVEVVDPHLNEDEIDSLTENIGQIMDIDEE
jgi:hypothetical protein